MTATHTNLQDEASCPLTRCRLRDVLNSGGGGDEPFSDLHVLSREWLCLHGAPCKAQLHLDPQTAVQACPLCNELRLAEASGRQEDQAIRELSCGHHALYGAIDELAGDGRTALCLSGGGVRSAAFNLGVLQGLAGLGILHRFTYLSTVSGGGYIGAWLTAWRQRSGLQTVLTGLRWPSKEGPPPPQLMNLRHDTAYLTPRAGALSADTWTGIGLFLRNLLLNNLIVVPLVLALLIIPKLLLIAVVASQWPAGDYLAGLAMALISLGWASNAVRRPSWYPREDSDREKGSYLWMPRLSIALMFAAALLLTVVAAARLPLTPHGLVRALGSWAARFPENDSPAWAILAGAAIALTAFCIAMLAVRLKPSERKVADVGATMADIPFTVWVPLAVKGTLAGAVGGSFIALGLWAANQWTGQQLEPEAAAALLCLGPLWVATGYSLAETIYLALINGRPALSDAKDWNDRWGDEEREWVGRTHGYLAMIAAGSGLLFTAALFGPGFWHWMLGSNSWTWLKSALGIVGVIGSGLASVGLEASSLTGPRTTPQGKRRLPLNLVLVVATPVFVGLLLTLLSAAIDFGTLGTPLFESLSDPEGHPAGHMMGTYGFLCLGFALLGLVAARFVNINRFSLHDIYRLRLIREFLGATNQMRKEDPWTGFNTSDDLPLSSLQSEFDANSGTSGAAAKDGDGNRACLYPVINATLNTVGSNMLQWQERKGESFVFTPHYCGSAAINAYRKTEEYNGGVLLGSAMSISGAAASPNMGYSSIPGLSLLLSMFNVRLGVWAGNPMKAKFRERGPAYALRPLLAEAFARTTDTTDYVYLSDGGHFDNLGLYEMLRRRCRYIVLSDAGQDPEYAFADLGRAARRAAIDLGVQLTFEEFDLRKRCEEPFTGPYWAWGKIVYPESSTPGHILYIKAGFHGSAEPPDVRAYALSNPAFPHDDTANQFFDEAQFESYRALGFFIVESLAAQGRHSKKEPSIESLFALQNSGQALFARVWHSVSRFFHNSSTLQPARSSAQGR